EDKDRKRYSGCTPRERSRRSALMGRRSLGFKGGLKPVAPGRNGFGAAIFPFGFRPNSSRSKIAAPKPSSADAPARSFLAGAGPGSPGFVPPHRGADGMSRRPEGRRKEE